MHRLRKGKKGNKEEEDVPPVPAATTSHNPFKWGRTPEPPPKPELDIEHALPPSDDFRTSLLMPNLAQRFSILQMEAAAAAAAAASGKTNGENFSAADGFVFSGPQFMPLREITETSSLAETVTIEHNRLTTKSQESAVSDESAGVMDRSRGGGGNVLFGGRQKVYRVPNAYTSRDPADDSNPESPMSGRVVYDYDLSETAFTASGRKRDQDSEDISSPIGDSNGDNRNRYTSSSTNSTPTTITRSSTAATSVTSNSAGSGSIPASTSTSSLAATPGSMVANKPRRALYEQALDQQLQDQQSAATGRLEKLASLRKASASPPPANNYPLVGNFGSSEPGQQRSTSSPSSPAASQPQWTVNVKKSPDSSMSAPEETEEEEVGDEAPKKDISSGGLSPHMAQFNFGLEPRSQSPISAPVSASAIHFPTQGPFSPGNLRGDQHQGIRSPEKIISPLEQKWIPSPLSDISDQYGHSTADSRKFLSVRTSSDSSSYDDPDDSENERIGGIKPVSRSYLDKVAPLHLRKSGTSSMDSVSEPLEPVSPVSPISPIFSERKSDPSIRGLKPLRNPAISPTSPQFSSGTHVPSDDDSPTLPAGPGLSTLIHQHLRTDSSHSSVYAGSTYTRMSRSSRYVAGPSKSPGVYGAAKVAETARPAVSGTSGSSGGNMWEFDDWDAGYYAEDDNRGLHKPAAIDTPPPPPSIPVRDTARMKPEERKDDEELAKERGRAESRFSERDRAMSRASERERSIPAAAEDEHDKDWEQQLAFRRQIIQQNLRNHEKVNSQHEMDFPSENFKDSRSKNNGSPSGFGVLRSKGSNGILSKNDPSVKPLKQNGRDSPGPGLRKEGRSRMNSDADRRAEEERILRETVRGPKNIPSVNYPTQQQHSHHNMAPHRPGHLNTNQSPELRTQQRSPIGLPHPIHSPMHTPRLRQKPSHEQVNNGQNSSRGQPMGWKDEKDHLFSAPRSAPSTQPNTPTTPNDRHMPQKQASMPRMNGPEMYRPNQGQPGDRDSRQGRGNPERSRVRENGPPNGAHMNHGPVSGGHGVMRKESFDRGDTPSDFRRPRGNSNAAPGPTMRQRRGTFDGTQLPPINTTSLTPAQSPQLQSSISPAPPQSAVSADKSPAYTQMHSTLTNTSTPSSAVSSTKGPTQLAQTMTSANALYTPAKKRVIDKSKIGEPKLLSSTSNITTVDLPVQIPQANGKSSKRRMTETRSIFSGFGKNKSTEEVPALPTGSPMIPHRRSDEEVERSSFTDDPPPKKKGQGKLRKSTSDGGALGARARKQEAMMRSPTMPKISKTMAGGPPAGMI